MRIFCPATVVPSTRPCYVCNRMVRRDRPAGPLRKVPESASKSACQCRVARPPWSGVSRTVHRTRSKPSVQMPTSPPRPPRGVLQSCGQRPHRLGAAPGTDSLDRQQPAPEPVPTRPTSAVQPPIRDVRTLAPKEQPANHDMARPIGSNRRGHGCRRCLWGCCPRLPTAGLTAASAAGRCGPATIRAPESPSTRTAVARPGRQ